MGNGMYCRKVKPQKPSSEAKSEIKVLTKMGTKELIDKIKSEIQNNMNSNTSIAFLTGLELNRILISGSNGFDIQTIIKLAEMRDWEPILDISNKIYVMISSLARKLNENNEKHKNLIRLAENMKLILDDLVLRINQLDLANLQYKNIPLLYLEVMIELFQIILTYQSGNLIDESHAWWNRAKYGDNLQFYETRFIELAGKIRYEVEFIESTKLRSNKIPRPTYSTGGYGLRAINKKNTTEIKDQSDRIHKEKMELQILINGYLTELNAKSCKKFSEVMNVLKEKTENITEDVDSNCQPHRIPIPGNIFINKKGKKR